MNRKILQKVLDELAKEKPDLSYIRGMLETLLEGLPNEKTPESKDIAPILYNTIGVPFTPSNVTVLSESQILENETKAKLESIKATVNKSVQIE